MFERFLLAISFASAIYSLYCSYPWLCPEYEPSVDDETQSKSDCNGIQNILDELLKYNNQVESTNTVKIVDQQKYKPAVPRILPNACSVLEIFTKKPEGISRRDKRLREMENSDNSIAVLGILIFLAIVTIHGILDVLNFKEEEKQKVKANPSGERRQSLSEFANKKSHRSESGKLGLNLFKIAETPTAEEEPKPKRLTRPYVRGESTNSYLTEKHQENDTYYTKSSETPTGDQNTLNCSSDTKVGGRPPAMVRRSSFPALPLNPEIQALMLGERRPSTDSDDEDGKGRRVRIIRRF